MHAEVERRVRRFVDDLDSSRVGRDVLAVVVSGSAARGEERWLDGRLLSDIDVMVISRSSTLRLDRSAAVEHILAAHGADGLEGGRIPVSTLRYATLANYEARHRGVVVAGDRSVLARIPLEGPADLPAWEAVRLLANRLFEHLKHRAGLTSGEAASIKSYEAIGEAQLVLERRYQPSFRERVAEMRRRPLAGPVAGAEELYIRAERIRRGESLRLDVTPVRALDDLLCQLENTLLTLYGRAGELDEQFAALARNECHPTHRAYWALRGLGQRSGWYRPTQDPIIRLWRTACAALTGSTVRRDSAELVRLWQQCPQILRNRSRT